jgi:hypothetical protein
VLSMIEETPAPWTLDETRAFLAGAVLRQNARNAAALVQPQLDFAARALPPGAHSQGSTVDDGPGEGKIGSVSVSL